MYLATYGGYSGIGNTPTEAYKDLKDNYADYLEVHEATFFEGKEIKVKHEIQVVTTTKVTKVNIKGKK